MTLPGASDLHHVLDRTWPAASTQKSLGWTIREGKQGGNRVSSATGVFGLNPEIKVAEKAMFALNQTPIFMIRHGDETLDAALANLGYEIRDQTTLYAANINALTGKPATFMSAFPTWPPLAITTDLWAEGGIGPARVAVMERVTGPKTSILGRTDNRASAAAFVAIERKIAMLHALEVTPVMRRKGVGRNILRAAAHWAQENGAQHFSLAVTAANLPANALYSEIGMTVVGKYHYRVKKKQETNRGST